MEAWKWLLMHEPDTQIRGIARKLVDAGLYEDACEFAEAYASSRLAEVTGQRDTLADWLEKAEADNRTLRASNIDLHRQNGEVSAQLADAVMFLRIVLTRKDVTTLNCLKPKIADWLKRTGNEGSILREVK